MDVRRQTSVNTTSSGFTLIEVTLALLIAAIVMSIVYGSVKAGFSSYERISLRNKLDRANYALLEDMGRELSAAFLSTNRAINTGNTKTYFHIENPEENGMHMARLYFTTYGHALSPNPLGEADQSEVCYQAQHNRARDELTVLKKEDLSTNDATCKNPDAFDVDRLVGERPYVVATGIHAPEKGSAGYRLIGFEVTAMTDQNQQGQFGSSQGQSGQFQSQFGSSQGQSGQFQSQFGSSQGQSGASQHQSGESQSQFGAASQSGTGRGENRTSTDEDQIKTWDTEDDVAQVNRLPRQVKVTLTYEGPQKDIIPFTRTVWLQLSAPVAQTAAALEQANATTTTLIPTVTTTTLRR